jgi:3-methyladenine DNA glycosylase Tag
MHEILLTNKTGAEFVIHNARSTLRMSRNRRTYCKYAWKYQDDMRAMAKYQHH